MADRIKFRSKIEQQVLDELRRFAKESGRTISSILTEAVSEYLARARVRPVFLAATEEVLDENADLLTRLAQ